MEISKCLITKLFNVPQTLKANLQFSMSVDKVLVWGFQYPVFQGECEDILFTSVCFCAILLNAVAVSQQAMKAMRNSVVSLSNNSRFCTSFHWGSSISISVWRTKVLTRLKAAFPHNRARERVSALFEMWYTKGFHYKWWIRNTRQRAKQVVSWMEMLEIRIVEPINSLLSIRTASQYYVLSLDYLKPLVSPA